MARRAATAHQARQKDMEATMDAPRSSGDTVKISSMAAQRASATTNQGGTTYLSDRLAARNLSMQIGSNSLAGATQAAGLSRGSAIALLK